MLYTIKILKSIDQFGVSFQPSIQYSSSEYKTWQGGVVSLLLYGLSFSYLIYVFIQWQTGQILPTNTTISQYEPNYALQFNDTFIEFELNKYRYTDIDPFNSSAIIFQPVAYYFVNGDAPTAGYPFSYEISNSSSFQNVVLKNLNISISQDQNNENPQIQMMLVLSSCVESFLQSGQKCADNTTITNFFKQPTNTLKAKMYIKQFNMNTKVLDTIKKEFYLPIYQSSTYFAQTSVQIAQASVDTGVLLQDSSDYSFISDTSLAGNLVDVNYFTKIFGVEIYAGFYYNIDSIQVIQSISYAKIGDILANAGSIASTLLLLSYLVILMNQKYLEFEAVNSIIQMYYPDFKNVKIFKNVFGKIIKVERNGKNLDIGVFKKYYEKLRKIGEVKLTISNQIYEISRMQFLIQTLFTDKQIQQIHNIGIPLSIGNEDQPVNSNPEGGVSKLEQSINHDYQYKTNQIYPNCQSNDDLPENRLKDEELPRQDSTQQQITVNVTQDKLLKQISNEPPPIQNKIQELILKDKDFGLLIIQEENEEQEEIASQNPQSISKNVSNDNLLNQQNI